MIWFFSCSWDDELAEVAQIWADQCANVVYFPNSDIYPRIFHERGFERTTSRFNSAPGVGQNVAWALTKHVNFTRIIDDLWYRDINKLQPGRIDDFQVKFHFLSKRENLWNSNSYYGSYSKGARGKMSKIIHLVWLNNGKYRVQVHACIIFEVESNGHFQPQLSTLGSKISLCQRFVQG